MSLDLKRCKILLQWLHNLNFIRNRGHISMGILLSAKPEIVACSRMTLAALGLQSAYFAHKEIKDTR